MGLTIRIECVPRTTCGHYLQDYIEFCGVCGRRNPNFSHEAYRKQYPREDCRDGHQESRARWQSRVEDSRRDYYSRYCFDCGQDFSKETG